MRVAVSFRLKVRNSWNILGVNWTKNMPLSPWYGGFFERLVRSTKEVLRKVLNGCRLNYEELQTVLLETEAI